MKKSRGLRKRWLMNTVGVVCALGIICVLAVTLAFSAYYYSSMEADLRYRARTTADFFEDYLSLSYKDYYQSCINYAKSFAYKDKLELQFIDAQGRLVATSYGGWTGELTATSDIRAAVDNRITEKFIGNDPATGEHIIAISSPMIYSNGEVIGVLRYVSSTQKVDRQIAIVACVSVASLAVVVLVVLFSSNYYIRSILIPLGQVTEKAKKIAGGSYGIQIKAKYDDEIGELVETINEMSLQINQNEKAQREFISSLSHELRTPLTAITGWSETLLADESLDPDTQRGMGIILREGKRLTEMVVDLLDFTRIQDGRMTLNIEPSDIRSEFEDTVYMYRSRLSQEDIRLIYHDNDDDIPEIPCDPKRLRQVFLNILDNAATHGGDGKRIDVSIHLEGGDVVVRIRDHGCGIPEDELSLVKRKFYKGSSATRGSGIGLAVSDEIVSMHNGELTLKNAEGGGTLVTVRLPISQ